MTSSKTAVIDAAAGGGAINVGVGEAAAAAVDNTVVVTIMTVGTSDYPLQLALGFFVDGWVAIRLCISTVIQLTHGGRKNNMLVLVKKQQQQKKKMMYDSIIKKKEDDDKSQKVEGDGEKNLRKSHSQSQSHHQSTIQSKQQQMFHGVPIVVCCLWEWGYGTNHKNF